MKKTTTTTFITLLAILLLPGVLAAIPSGPALSVSLLRYDPTPAEPGSVIDVYVSVTNEGGSSASQVRLEMIDNNPFSVDNPGDAVKTLPGLPGQESWIGHFKVRTSNDATDGTNYVKVRLTMDDSTAAKDFLFPIIIKSHNPVLSVKSISIDPAVVRPGSEATITILLTNLADSRMKDISVELSTQRTLGATTTLLPFAPIEGTLETRIAALDPHQDATATFRIITQPGADSDIYRIPLTITFSDESGNNYERQDEVGLVVNAEPDLEVYLETVGIYANQKQGDITIKFVNKGLAKLKLVTAEIGESPDYEFITQSRQTYIGTIDSDDYQTATYTLKATADQLNIPVKVQYLDAFNKKYEKQVVLSAKLQESSTNGKGSSSSTVIILVIVVLIVGFIIYRVVRKRRKKKP
jgi:hypothetical protein